MAPSVLARGVEFGVEDTAMPRQGIRPPEGLLLGAEVALQLLLACVVNSVLVPGQVVRARKHRIARLACARLDAIAAVGTSLAAEELGRQASRRRRHGGWLHTAGGTQAVSLSVAFSLVLLQ